jgi:TRAP-type transport system periplasmic protein
MQQGLTRRALGRSAIATIGTFGILRHARAQTALKIRCSLDTAPSHPRNQAIVDFLGKLKDATGGTVDNEVFHSGSLFPDLQVAKALLQGQVDMAAPGLWTQTGIVPDADFCQLPVFYGRDAAATERASDGAAGKIVTGQLESKLKVNVLGPYIDLGMQNWYTTKIPLRTSADIKGLKIRSPGGVGISWRISFFGGIPNTTAWPQVPLALSQGTFDGFVSTNESCASAKLWEAGVKYSYQDHQYFGQYVPMFSGAFWEKVTPDVRKIMADLWASNISTYRQNAARSQDNARKMMEANGVQFVDPPASVLDDARKAQQADVATLIKQAKLSPDVVKAAEDSVNA